MPMFGNTGNVGSLWNGYSSWIVIGVLLILAVSVVVMYTIWPTACPTEIRRNPHGELRLLPSGQEFPDMNAFQNWWYASGLNMSCPIPVLTGAKDKEIMNTGDYTEQTYAKTPINKVDDYEFSRIFGVERQGHMILEREDYNKILVNRAMDWTDKPYSSDERKRTYTGLQEGFTAEGDLTSEAITRYREEGDSEYDCKRENKHVARMIAKAYESDPAWEPVVTQTGPNNWEVNELIPRRRHGEFSDPEPDTVVNTENPDVDIRYRYRTDAIDPYYTKTGMLDSESGKDPYRGYVPGMERMFGPTFDHIKWS